MQNSMTGGTDRASTARSFVRGEGAVAFVTALQEERKIDEGDIVPNIPDNVNEALKPVTHTDFPFHSLKTQHLWMNRKMFNLS
jgi:hypothetical protein